MLLHNSGQYIKGVMELIDIEMKGTNSAQNRGAVLSYFRRYGIQAIIGMASEDSDGVSKTAANNNAKASAAVAKADATVKANFTGITGQKTIVAKEEIVAEKKLDAPASRGSFRKNAAVAANEEL
jgi:hypothetical protein